MCSCVHVCGCTWVGSTCLNRSAIVVGKPCCTCVFCFQTELDIGVTAQVQTAQTARRALSVMLPAVLVVSFCVCLLFRMRRCFD